MIRSSSGVSGVHNRDRRYVRHGIRQICHSPDRGIHCCSYHDVHSLCGVPWRIPVRQQQLAQVRVRVRRLEVVKPMQRQASEQEPHTEMKTRNFSLMKMSVERRPEHKCQFNNGPNTNVTSMTKLTKNFAIFGWMVFSGMIEDGIVDDVFENGMRLMLNQKHPSSFIPKFSPFGKSTWKPHRPREGHDFQHWANVGLSHTPQSANYPDSPLAAATAAQTIANIHVVDSQRELIVYWTDPLMSFFGWSRQSTDDQCLDSLRIKMFMANLSNKKEHLNCWWTTCRQSAVI